MSNSNVFNLMGDKMDKPVIELPSINCTACGAENSLSEAISAGVMDALLASVSETAESNFEKRLTAERNRFQQEAVLEAQKLSSEQLKGMTQQLSDLTTQKTQLEVQMSMAEANTASMQQTMQSQIELAATAAVDKARASFALTEREQQEEIDRLKKSIAALKSTTNAGSPQLTGESGELLIEDRLHELFPRDLIDEVKKGQNGADCLWTVRNNGGGTIGKIYFESKVTQTFQSSWLQKLKDDMVEKGASVGIIVTKTMPSDQPYCGLREGVWVCGFHEFETLAKAMRQAQVELSRALSQEAAKEGASNELFDFVVGREFSGIMEKILRPIFEQQQLLEKEKRSITRLWKAREKHIQNSVNGASMLAGQLETILGASVVNQIGFEKFDVLEIIEDEEKDND